MDRAQLRRTALGSVFLTMAFTGAGLAETYHVDPAAAAEGADGSSAHPWPSLQAAFAAGRLAGGDTVDLAAGTYGAVTLAKVGFATPLTLLSAPGHGAHFSKLTLTGTRNLVVDGIRVAPEQNVAGKHGQLIEENGTNTVLRNLDVWGQADVSDFYSWSKDDWNGMTYSGVRSRGKNLVLENSTFTATDFAIGTVGDGAKVLHNTIHGFSGDGIRAIGDNTLVEGNLITDCFKVNDNHDDGFQSWSRGPKGKSGGGTVTGLTVTGNTIIEWTGPKDHPLHGALQGISMFDGMFKDLTVSNNVIDISAFHGIALYGGLDSKIVNNTLINWNGISRKAPWIAVHPHRNHTRSHAVTVANNIGPKFDVSDLATDPGSHIENNQVVIYPARDLQLSGPDRFHLKPDSPLRGTADPAYAPAVDHDGKKRSGRIDPGAFQGN